jgi:hypothetical protein
METANSSNPLETRLARLEREVRRYRLLVAALVLMAAVAITMGATQGIGVQNSVKAKNFYIVDDNGNNLAVLGTSRAGTAGLWFYDSGSAFIVVEQEKGPHAIMHAKYFDVKADGKRIASLGTSKINTPGLWFYEGSNEFIVIEKDKAASAVMHASQFEIRDNEVLLGALGTSQQKQPGLWFRDSTNNQEYTIIGSNGNRVWVNEVENGQVKAVQTRN